MYKHIRKTFSWHARALAAMALNVFTVVSTIVSSGGAHHKQQRINLHSSEQELGEV